MSFCYELTQGCCGCPIRSTVNVAFCHYVIYGIFAVIFTFTNSCYPPWYYVDYMFGGSGATLIVVGIIAGALANSKKVQPLRFIFAYIITLNVLTVVVATFYYTIERWDDVVITAFTRALRNPIMTDFPDYLWYFLVLLSCLNCPIFLIYLMYIISYMCNKWKSYLFSDPYQGYIMPSPFVPTLTVPSVPESNAYPTNKGGQHQRSD